MLYQKVLEVLTSAGYEAYLVGGCVRDILIGRQPKDYDITTSALPDQVKELFPDSKFVGEQFGVSLVSDGWESVEVATFRSDGAYKDSRHPESVKFTDNIFEDLERRDFTMNAIALDIYGNYICRDDTDLGDIDACIIRCVGDPDQRFEEDALRIMRAVRFSGQLGFNIHPETESAIINNSWRLDKISRERIAIELNKLLLFSWAARRFSWFPRLKLMQPLFSGYAMEDNWLDTIELLKGVLHHKNLHLALAALFLYSGKSQVKRNRLGGVEYPKLGEHSAVNAENWLTEFKYASTHIEKVGNLLRACQTTDEYLNAEKVEEYQWKRLIRSVDFEAVIRLYVADVKVTGINRGWCENYLYEKYHSCLKTGLFPTLPISGDDLIAIGLKPNKRFKEILTAIENALLNGTVVTKEAALDFARLTYTLGTPYEVFTTS